jgi:hypothetical protein
MEVVCEGGLWWVRGQAWTGCCPNYLIPSNNMIVYLPRKNTRRNNFTCPWLVLKQTWLTIRFLQWSTEAEIDNAGFNIYRAESEYGNYIKINSSLVPAQGSSTHGASYEFVDKDVQNRKTYCYKLEDIDLDGTSTMHGPVNATPRWFWGILVR